MLGSRERLCSNRDVLDVNEGTLQHRCKMAIKEERCSYYAGLQENDYAQAVYQQLVKPSDSSIFDIEDLWSLGQCETGCSFFTSQVLVADAEIVFCPYNYLLDPSMSKALKINLGEAVVVLDEG